MMKNGTEKKLELILKRACLTRKTATIKATATVDTRWVKDLQKLANNNSNQVEVKANLTPRKRAISRTNVMATEIKRNEKQKFSTKMALDQTINDLDKREEETRQDHYVECMEVK